MDWLMRLRSHYPHLVWLNPEPPPQSGGYWGGYWGESYGKIADVIDMYPLSVDGMNRAFQRLLKRHG